VLARRRGLPLGCAVISVDEDGSVRGDRLQVQLRQQLTPESGATFFTDPIRGRPRLLLSRHPAGHRILHRTVSVVIPTCANAATLERCLASVLASDYHDFEVIVVENRPSSSATRRMLRDRFRGELRLRYAEEPVPGVSQARNAGLSVAEGELVAFIDDDVIVDRAWIRRAVEAFGPREEVACVTGLILPLELESDSQLLLEQFMALGKGFRRQVYRLPEARVLHPLLPYAAGVIGSGANTVVRADVARELGGFDTTLGPSTPAVGGEDLDFYIRLLERGHAVAYEPSAIVLHRHPEGMRRLRRQVYRYGIGLTATLTKHLLIGGHRRMMLAAVPAAIRYLRDPTSRKNAAKRDGYPRRLDWLERLGMAVGPPAYIASALTTGFRRRRQAARRPALERERVSMRRIALSGGRVIDVVEVSTSPPTWPVETAPAARPVSRAVASPAELAFTAAAALACIAAPLLVALKAPAGVRFLAVLALFCVAPGAALIPLLRGKLEFGLVLGASFGVIALVAQTMLWLGAWDPKAFLYGLALVCLAPLLAPLHSAAQSLPGIVGRRTRSALTTLPPALAVHGLVLTGAIVAWSIALRTTHLTRMAGLGLLDAVPPTYFVAFGLVLIGFAAAVSRRRIDSKLLALYTLALLLLLYGTIPLLYSEPRFTWSYKHFGVIELISATGAVHREIDIYNNWPAFFAANAWLRSVTGLAPVSYAAGSQLFFNLANVAAMLFALRGLTSDKRLRWMAAWLFLLGNWVQPTEEDLAPQAFAFVLSLVVLGLCLRCSPMLSYARLGSAVPGRGWIDRLFSKIARGAAPLDDLPPPPLGNRAALLVGGLCFLTVVISHQLSPVMVIVSVAVLALLIRRLPLWLPLAMCAIEAWWIALAWPYLSKTFSLLDPGLPGAAPSGRDLHAALPGAVLSFYAPAAVIALIALLALIGCVRRLRAGQRDVVPVCLILAVPPVAAVQSYGGIGLYRAFLFALPWLAFFAAAAFVSKPTLRWSAPTRVLLLGGTSVLVCGCLLIAVFGQDLANRVSSDEVGAEVWLEQHAPPGSTIMHAAEGPVWLTRRYPFVGLEDTLLKRPEFRRHLLGPTDVPRVASVAAQLRPASPLFLVLSRRQNDYAQLNGMLPAGSIARLAWALQESPAFHLIYRRPTTWVFQFVQRRRVAHSRQVRGSVQ
jgi:GT2 family glycosyltransferase